MVKPNYKVLSAVSLRWVAIPEHTPSLHHPTAYARYNLQALLQEVLRAFAEVRVVIPYCKSTQVKVLHIPKVPKVKIFVMQNSQLQPY